MVAIRYAAFVAMTLLATSRAYGDSSVGDNIDVGAGTVQPLVDLESSSSGTSLDKSKTIEYSTVVPDVDVESNSSSTSLSGEEIVGIETETPQLTVEDSSASLADTLTATPDESSSQDTGDIVVETPSPSVVVEVEGSTTSSTTSSTSAGSTSTSSVPNWVGPNVGDASDSACYRETHSKGTACPLGYSESAGTCWAQCPLSYPVECGMECIPQNDDCLLEVLTKIASVADVALNAATAGVFGQITAASKAVQLGVSCGKQLYTVSKSVVSYMRAMQTTDAGSTEAQILETISQADVVLVDLPVAVATCLGLDIPTDTTDMAKSIVDGVEEVLKVIIESDGDIIGSASSFIEAIGNITAGSSVSSLSSEDVQSLSDLIDSGSDCGANLKTLSDKAVIAVADIRNATPGISTEDVRSTVSTSDLVLTEIPAVTNDCMAELLETVTSDTAYATRDSIRKTFGVILEQLVTTGTTDGGSTASTVEYLADIADMGLGVISTFDPTGIASMMAEFIQPICGPTAFLGDIDDGSLADALGLVTVDDAFSGSYGTWTKAGDGVVTIIFESTDTEDVTVVIHSGGDTVEEVDVASGETVTWSSTVSALQDKTMYLDRWRPGFLGLPGSGGGSLNMWIPRSSQGGHLELHAKINVS